MTRFGKSAVAPDAIHRHAQQLRSEFLELGKDLVVKRHLIAAHWAPVRRIKSQNHRLAAQLTQAEPLVWCDGQTEIRGALPAGSNSDASIRIDCSFKAADAIVEPRDFAFSIAI